MGALRLGCRVGVGRARKRRSGLRGSALVPSGFGRLCVCVCVCVCVLSVLSSLSCPLGTSNRRGREAQDLRGLARRQVR